MAPSSTAGPSTPVVDATIYAQGFWPQIDLQYHKPPSCKALKWLRLSVLPAAPKSLSKPPKQGRKGSVGPASTVHLPGLPMTTLLDPLILSGDGTIAQGLAQVDTINTQLELLGKVVNSFHADWEDVISELADGLDSFASCEHGSEIIDAHTAVSDFLKSFIVHPGSGGSGDVADV
ncbi:hypothetical protein IW261DRAFT_1426966 [Armillaria novae-zelandiae]|uniref:Uncharacterized protein n=1 Tax=Armillaria novae-zelandiae TaxID=153914 RepID=A0AA39NJ48_9AGAR|nr:hypothetical protein IW261DRAFT_1426966 [Armillaria novae-zelandiae]